MTAPKWYDLTISKDAMRKSVVESGFINEAIISNDLLEKHLQEILDKICERYAYGNEEGKDGYKHFQCRIVCIKPTDENALRLYLVSNGIPAHTSPTQIRNFEYVQKEGNFYCSWEAVLNKFARGTPVMWQLIALEMWNKQNDREILVIADEKGRHGKSWLRKYMVATHKAAFIPPLEKAEDIMAMAMAKPSKGYVIDMPRAEGKVKKAMWSAIEQIKDGYLYDKRYQWKEKWIDPPKVMVFCNDYNENNLTTDRWVPLDITDFPQEF